LLNQLIVVLDHIMSTVVRVIIHVGLSTILSIIFSLSALCLLLGRSALLGDLSRSSVGSASDCGGLLGTGLWGDRGSRLGAVFIEAESALDLAETDLGSVGIVVTSTLGNQSPVNL
jgi:hypothetical protein